MWQSKALTAAVVAAALASGAGCVTRSAYNRDLAAERQNAAALQKELDLTRQKLYAVNQTLDQANKDVKKAWDFMAAKEKEYADNQKKTDDARRQVADLKRQLDQLKEADKNTKAATEKAAKESADKLKTLQDQFDAAQKEIADLKWRLEGKSPAPTPPIEPATKSPATGAPAGTAK